MHTMCNNNWQATQLYSLALIQTECLGLFLAPCVLYRQ